MPREPKRPAWPWTDEEVVRFPMFARQAIDVAGQWRAYALRLEGELAATRGAGERPTTGVRSHLRAAVTAARRKFDPR